MKLAIRKYGDPALRAKGKRVAEIDDAIRELADNMLETMRGANGIGLAAQQVGHALQLTVVDISAVEDRPSAMAWNGKEVDPKEQMPLVLLNPQIQTGPEKEIASEGCLSFPEISAEIERADWVKVQAQTLMGETVEIEATGLAPSDLHESALVTSLSLGPYTAIVRGNNGATGVGLVEVYSLQ